jgi:multidrug efflux pump subunit AcrA (membrane-fusion protein)
LGAKLRHLENQMEQTVIESPIDGIVTAVNTGNIVIDISRIDTVKLRIYVPEKEISVIKLGYPVKMKVRSFPALTYAGVVTKIEPPIIDKADKLRVVVVNAKIVNSDGALKPGMTGKAKINCGNWPIYRLILWRIVRYIRVEFWSWW